MSNKIVYFIQNEMTGAIKIGFAADAHARFATLKCASSDPLAFLGCIPGGKDVEAALHERFASLRIRGEWFKPDAELIAHINGLVDFAKCQPARVARPKFSPYIAGAARWVEEIIRFNNVAWHKAPDRERLAKLTGQTIGFLENLRRGRLKRISVDEYEALRSAYEASAARELEELTALLAAVRGAGSEFAQCDAHLSKARALLKGDVA